MAVALLKRNQRSKPTVIFGACMASWSVKMKQTTTLEVRLLESFSTGFWPWCKVDGLTKRGRMAHGIWLLAELTYHSRAHFFLEKSWNNKVNFSFAFPTLLRDLRLFLMTVSLDHSLSAYSKSLFNRHMPVTQLLLW